MTTPKFSSARDAILYFAAKHSDGLVTREEVDQEDDPRISAGGHPLPASEYPGVVEAFEQLVYREGLLNHDVGDNFLLTEHGKEIGAAIRPL